MFALWQNVYILCTSDIFQLYSIKSLQIEELENDNYYRASEIKITAIKLTAYTINSDLMVNCAIILSAFVLM